MSEFRRLLYICLFGVLLVISFFGHCGGLLNALILAIIAILISFSMGIGISELGTSFLSPFISGLYWPDRSMDPSYENLLYQDDMEKAQRIVREAKWDKAIIAYREIALQVPNRIEPRYYLAQVYQRVGHFGLAMGEYQKIIKLNEMKGAHHPFALESERAICELKKFLSAEKV
jgi:tetratricopeptide (TPR) repeat protein